MSVLYNDVIYIISADKVKKTTLIGDATDEKFINSAILFVQDSVLQDLIGTVLYTEILEQSKALAASGTPIAEPYAALMPMIDSMLVWHVAHDVSLGVALQATNKGTLRKNSESGQPVDISDLYRVATSYKNKGEFYAARLRNYLIKNSNTYPEYSQNNDIDQMKPNSQAYTNGMYTGTVRTRRGFGYLTGDNND